jgi:uncharacterized membrane protein YvbJ
VPRTPEICPTCGAVVPDGARACPECGADEKTGWSEKARSDDLGIPDEEFDYDEFVRREFEGEKPRRRLEWLWALVALILIALFVFAFRRH